MSYVRSMRSRKYGTQPMPPSDSAILMSGNSLSTRLHTRSAAACTMFIGCKVINTSIGASGVVIANFDDEPMCMQMTVPLVGARLPERVPVRVVQRRAVERRRVLREGDRMAAHVGEPMHFCGRLLGVPDHRHAERDEPAGVRAAPLVDVPVVVRLHHGAGDVVVLGRGEQPARRNRASRGSRASRARRPAFMSLMRSSTS